jgi:mannose/cellobiose epimerase-like protein (N-acyl-D-glucosamine 2-epimerase family)
MDKTQRVRQTRQVILPAVALALMTMAGSSAWSADAAPKNGITRAPQAVIDQHLDAPWLKSSLLDLVGHVVDNALEPSGYVQLNMDRHWRPYGVQREATVESQGRQLYSMVIAYENSHDKRYLDAMEKASDFLLKMRDPQYGGYFTRVTPDLQVLDETKSYLQAYALFAFANAYRVTKEQKYLDAAMEVFQVLRKMKVADPYINSLSRDLSHAQMSAYMKDMHHTDVPYYDPPRPPAAAGAAASLPGGPNGHSISNDLFEAYLDLYQATHSKEVWAEITAQLALVDKMYDYKLGYLPSMVDENWKAVRMPGMESIPAGILEPARLFQWANIFSRVVEMGADPKYIAMGNRSIVLGIKMGYDDDTGGLGGVDAKGRPVNTFWWSQAELLKTLGRYAALHGRNDLWPYYDKTLAYIKENFIDTQFGGWYDQNVPGWTRGTLAEWTFRAYVKGSQDANEFDAFHQSSMYKNLLALSQPQ